MSPVVGWPGVFMPQALKLASVCSGSPSWHDSWFSKSASSPSLAPILRNRCQTCLTQWVAVPACCGRQWACHLCWFMELMVSSFSPCHTDSKQMYQAGAWLCLITVKGWVIGCSFAAEKTQAEIFGESKKKKSSLMFINRHILMAGGHGARELNG